MKVMKVMKPCEGCLPCIRARAYASRRPGAGWGPRWRGRWPTFARGTRAARPHPGSSPRSTCRKAVTRGKKLVKLTKNLWKVKKKTFEENEMELFLFMALWKYRQEVKVRKTEFVKGWEIKKAIPFKNITFRKLV
jgi:hypothetical protein